MSRQLLHAGLDGTTRHIQGVGHDDDEMASPLSLQLRIAGVFIILAGGLVGSLPALLCRSISSNQDGMVTRMLKAFSAGVVLSLALVHIVPESLEDIAASLGESGVEYPVGGTCVLLGLLALLLLEHAAMSFLRRRASRVGAGSHGHVCTFLAPGGVVNAETADSTTPAPPSGVARHCKGDLTQGPVSEAEDGADKGGAHHSTVDRHDHEHDHAHGHLCIVPHPATVLVASGQAETLSARRAVVAYMMELGCILHSVLIGLALGAADEASTSTLVALVVAITIHQAVEGLGLGVVVAGANFTRPKGICMLVFYSLTTPIGVAIGVAATSAAPHDGGLHGPTSLAIQALLNCVAAGLLLHIALFQLLAEEFTRDDLQMESGWANRARIYGSVLLGAGVMCAVAVWA